MNKKVETDQSIEAIKLETKEVKMKDIKEKVSQEATVSELKKPIRRAVIEPQGRLHIDPSKKRKDMVYRFVNDQPGKISYARELGYEFVNEDFEVGDGTVNEASALGSAKVVEAGKYKGSVKTYLMACPKETYDARQESKHEQNDAVLKNTLKANRRPDQPDPFEKKE